MLTMHLKRAMIVATLCVLGSERVSAAADAGTPSMTAGRRWSS
jgi:hypothetical protein